MYFRKVITTSLSLYLIYSMNRHNLLFLCLLVGVLTACGKRDPYAVELHGEIKGLTDDTLYLCGIDQFYTSIDTLPVKGGKFHAVLQTDTLVETRLCFPDGRDFPLFFAPGDRIELKGDTASLPVVRVKGNEENELLAAFYQLPEEAPELTEDAWRTKAEQFIRTHPTSLAGIYLLDCYFMQDTLPDWGLLRELTEQMASELRDRPVVHRLRGVLDEVEKVSVGKSAAYFSLPCSDGKRVSRSDFRDSYLLVHFWASWDEAARRDNLRWRELYRHETASRKKAKEKERQLALLGISLDTDRAAWLQAVKADSLSWKQACELDGWSSKSVSQFAVLALPHNVFINPKGKIVGINVTPQVVADSIQQPIKK